jgi:GNAT superfamily N-acetyltransferase
MQIKIKDGFIDYETLNAEEVELVRIFVPEESRHLGTGTELLKELIKIADGKKIVTFSSTDPEREVFGKFLVAEGFKKTNEANNIGDKWELTAKIKVPVKEKVKEVVGKVKIKKKK